MAEGGVFQWKVQRARVAPHLRIEDYVLPLPPPPVGFHWQRVEDGQWILQEQQPSAPEDFIPAAKAEGGFIEHIIMPHDTLQGICLRYNTSVSILKKHNNFPAQNVRACRTLLIPVAPNQPFRPQDDTEDVKVQRMRLATDNELSAEEARGYLELCEWDVARAIKEWRDGCEFQAERERRAKLLEKASQLAYRGGKVVKPSAVGSTQDFSISGRSGGEANGGEAGVELTEASAVQTPLLGKGKKDL